MTEVRGSKEHNAAYRLAKARGKPFVVLRPFRHLASLSYDMFTVNYDLIPEAMAQVRALWSEILAKSPPRLRWFGVGPIMGFMDKIPLELGREYLFKLVEIVEDRGNWHPIGDSEKEAEA